MRVTNEYLIAGDIQTDPQRLRDLAASEDVAVRRRLAENPACPPEVLSILSKDPHPDVRASLVHNKSVGEDILFGLCEDDSVDVRVSLAEEHRLPLALLKKLADDSNPYVKDIAENTLETIVFERELESEGFIEEKGNQARLGELLQEAGLASSVQVERCLQAAQKSGRPLGQHIVQDKVVSRGYVIRALKLQSMVRKGKLPMSEAIAQLRPLK